MDQKISIIEIRGVVDGLDKVREYDQENQIFQVTLENENIEVKILNFGATITDLILKQKKINTILGYGEVSDFVTNNRPHLGSLCGRFANRIANGQFELDGVSYKLELNNFPNGIGCHLHGGTKGFDSRIFRIVSVQKNKLTLHLISEDGDQGYPGTLKLLVEYELLEKGIQIRYQAETDKATIINVTNHSYFNLSGDCSSILDHLLQINSEKIVEIREGNIPTGRLLSVQDEATPFDFRTQKQIGQQISLNHPQLTQGNGFDHLFVIEEKQDSQPEDITLKHAATLFDPKSSTEMRVFTSEPGVQLYTANFLKDVNSRDQLLKYAPRSGLCLETQHYPDSPNHPNFPTTVLRPGEKFHSITQYLFN